MLLIEISDNGKVHPHYNVLDFAFLDEEQANDFAESHCGKKLSKKQIKELKDNLAQESELPRLDDFEIMVQEVIDGA